MAIKPIHIPNAAGLAQSEGDVRHFSDGDSVSVPGISNTTRNLAERDNMLASKLNEVVGVVNNREQFVPLPILRTTMPSGEAVTVTNYRIPAGFEVRVLNASVASSPISSDIELNVYYASGYGNTSGTSIVTTAGEFTSGTSFNQKGELIVELKNKSGATLDIVGSLLLTMRPLGAEGSLLVASVVQGDQGPPGPIGPRGLQGIPGTGGAGSPGMIWTGPWVNGRGYNAKEVASFPLYGTVTSSYICTTAHTANTGNQPPAATYWDLVAMGSSGSVTGVQGPVGPAGGVPAYGSSNISGTFVTDTNFVGGTTVNGYVGGGTANGTTTNLFNEYYINSGTQASPNKGLAFLQGTYRRIYNGNVKIYLPQKSPEGAQVNWDTTNVVCSATINGSYGTLPVDTVQVTSVASNRYDVRVYANAPQRVSITLTGIQAIT